MARPLAKLLTGFFLTALLLVAAALVFALSQPLPAPNPLPKPNGYDDLIQASRLLADNTGDYANLNETELRALAAKNAEALKLARTGLSRTCQAPLDFAQPNPSYWTNLAKCKALAQAFAAEGRLAEWENRPNDAADSYLTAIRLGMATSNGGVIIDALVGVAIEAIGTVRLEKLALSLDASQCRRVASALESCETGLEPTTSVLEREKAWTRRAYGLKGQISRLFMLKSLRQMDKNALGRVNAQRARERTLLIQLAARAYELETGKTLKNPADLVPTYLKTIPQNPTTGTNMAYP